ncbi:MAG: DUF1499 domain-containing protein [Leptolyngbyaceae cyanobacterium RM1_1_2]|nr:DUF1499 domain-containing protein [Leptolyngbyaceae cyanobacterium RM1_1_2]
MSLFSFSGERPGTLGVKDGQLSACPDSPNCVNSQAADKEHSIAPLGYKGAATEAIARLKTLIESTEDAKIISAKDDYLYAEFASKLMGFVDDVEFFAPASETVIHVRSAARLGKSDLGVNRKRIELIRDRFES